MTLMLCGLQQICVDICTSGLIIAGIALCFVIILRGTGVFNVGYGALFVGAGYIYSVFYLGMPPFVAALFASVVLALIFAILDYGFRKLGSTQHHSARDRSLVASVGLALIVEHVSSWIFGTDTVVVSAAPISTGYIVGKIVFLGSMSLVTLIIFFAFRRANRWLSIGGPALWAIFSVIAAFLTDGVSFLPYGRLTGSLVAILCLLAVAVFAATRFGLRWKAYLTSPLTARSLGYPIERYRLGSAMAGGAMMSLQSAAHVINVGIRADESWRILIGASFVALLAQRFSVGLLVLSGITYALLSYLSVIFFSSAWTNVATFGLLFVLLAFKAQSANVNAGFQEE